MCARARGRIIVAANQPAQRLPGVRAAPRRQIDDHHQLRHMGPSSIAEIGRFEALRGSGIGSISRSNRQRREKSNKCTDLEISVIICAPHNRSALANRFSLTCTCSFALLNAT